MARTSRSTRSSTARSLEQEPDTSQSGIEPVHAPRETQTPVVTRSKRVSKPTDRISTHREQQAQHHVRSGNIKRGKARTARKAQKTKRRVESPNLSDTDYDDDDEEETWEDEDGINQEDADGGEAEDVGDEEYEPAPIAFEDTDLNLLNTHSDRARSDRDLLLERIEEATDKDFSSYSTEELRSFWRAYCAQQEADDEVEVQFPQITQAGTFELEPRVVSNQSPAVDKQTERGKRPLAELADIASKRACLSLDPNANPSLIDPPSSDPNPIAPPLFPARTAQLAQGTHPSGQAQGVGSATPTASRALLRTQNAPSPSLGPGGSQLLATTRLTSFPTATTVLDEPACLPVRMATPVAMPTPLRIATAAPSRAAPAPTRAAGPARTLAPVTATTTVAAPARAAAPGVAPGRVPASAAAPAHPARAPASVAAPTRAAAPSAAPARVLSIRAPAPVAAPARAPAPAARTPAPAAGPSRPPTGPRPLPAALAVARAPVGASSRLPAPRASPRVGSRLLSVPEEPDWNVDLGGPAPGVPARVRPYIPYTDLLDDRAEEIAEAEARQVGRPATGRKPKHTAKDYQGDARMMIPHTVKRQFALAVTGGAYDNRGIMVDLSQLAYEQTFPALFPTKELQYPDEHYFPMITNRGAMERGDVRKRIRPVVHNNIAKFIHPPMTSGDIEHNKDTVSRLTPRLFHYKHQDPPSEPYGSIDIQRALGAGLFHSLSAVGVIHRNLFGLLMPLPAMAFILTNIEVCIMEFADGTFQAIELNVAQQLNMYNLHLQGLQAYERRAPIRLAAMQKAWYKFAIAFAGIDDSEDEAEPQQAELDLLADIPPDSPEAVAEPEAATEPNTNAEPDANAEPLFSEAVGDTGAPVDEDGWQAYRLEDLYGNDTTDLEPEPEPEPEPELEPEPVPQPKYRADGHLTARAKGKGRALPSGYRR